MWHGNAVYLYYSNPSEDLSMITCYENARVFTGNGHTADCFAVENGRFIFVGSSRVCRNAYPDAACIDLGGRFVCPGFNDSHMHLLELGCVLEQVQLQEQELLLCRHGCQRISLQPEGRERMKERLRRI